MATVSPMLMYEELISCQTQLTRLASVSVNSGSPSRPMFYFVCLSAMDIIEMTWVKVRNLCILWKLVRQLSAHKSHCTPKLCCIVTISSIWQINVGLSRGKRLTMSILLSIYWSEKQTIELWKDMHLKSPFDKEHIITLLICCARYEKTQMYTTEITQKRSTSKG